MFRAGTKPSLNVTLLTNSTTNVLRVGQWLLGPVDDTQFLIQTIDAEVPQMVIGIDGSIFMNRIATTPQDECALRVICPKGSFRKGFACESLTVCAQGLTEDVAPTSTSDRTCKFCSTGTFKNISGPDPCLPVSNCKFETIGVSVSDSSWGGRGGGACSCIIVTFAHLNLIWM